MFGLTPKRLADTAYGSGDMLAWLIEHGIEPHIPVFDRVAQTNGVFTRNDFTFDCERNVFICPGEKSLPLAHERDNGMLLYRASGTDCGRCPLKSQCTRGLRLGCCLSTPMKKCASTSPLAGTEASGRERHKVEMLFAHLKRHLNFRRLRLRAWRATNAPWRQSRIISASSRN